MLVLLCQTINIWLTREAAAPRAGHLSAEHCGIHDHNCSDPFHVRLWALVSLQNIFFSLQFPKIFSLSSCWWDSWNCGDRGESVGAVCHNLNCRCSEAKLGKAQSLPAVLFSSEEAYVCLKKDNGNKKERILFRRIAEWPILNTSATAKTT